mmetsp:Transcript_49399/g.127482  ORF Transcript_49399/g.127482 Transcript_49399/m.127482 type:complete len:434 (-) Transcript_49399:158-1459(-)
MATLLGAMRRDGGKSEGTPLKPMPPDHVSKRSEELTQYDELVSAMEAFRSSIMTAVVNFEAAPTALLDHLGKAKCDAAPWNSLVPRLSAHLSACASRLQEGRRHIHAVEYLVEQCKEQCAEVRAAVKARDQAWRPKVLHDERAAALRKRFGPSFLLEEKKQRLKAKAEADKEFDRRTEVADKAIEDLLSRKWAITGAMVWEICRYYVSVFQDSQQLFHDFSDLANLVVPPASTEAAMSSHEFLRASPTGSPSPPSSARQAGGPSPPASARQATGSPSPPVSARQAVSPQASSPAVPVEEKTPQVHSRRPLPRPQPQPTAAMSPPLLPPLGQRTVPSSAASTSAEASASTTTSGTISRDSAAEELCRSYVKGQQVRVWSDTAQAWLEGVVEEVYHGGGAANGYLVPPGSLKVCHARGMKFIRPENIATSLRINI